MSHLRQPQQSILNMGRVGKAAARRVVAVAARSGLPIVGDLARAYSSSRSYRQHYGAYPNLLNPKTFNEKILWRKLFDRDPLIPIFSDKVRAKSAVGELIGYEHVVPTLWVGDRLDETAINRFDPPYVLKCNHGSGWNVFIRRGSELSAAAERINRWLAQDFSSLHGEWGYKDIPRKVLVEPLL